MQICILEHWSVSFHSKSSVISNKRKIYEIEKSLLRIEHYYNILILCSQFMNSISILFY